MLFSAERLKEPVVRKRIKTFDSKIKRRQKLDEEADAQKAAPTIPLFDPNLVTQENDEELDPMPDGPHDSDSFTPGGEKNHYVLAQIKMPLGDEEVISTVKRCKRYNSGKIIVISN